MKKELNWLLQSYADNLVWKIKKQFWAIQKRSASIKMQISMEKMGMSDIQSDLFMERIYHLNKDYLKKKQKCVKL